MISDQAFIIHKRKYKDSSEIVKLLTRQNGIIDVLAKGSFGNKSKFKGQLHPFIELQVTYTGRSELKTLVDANQSGHLPACDYLNHVAMLYCNELLYHLNLDTDVARSIYKRYQSTIALLNGSNEISLLLRKFEWSLSRLQGYELNIPSQVKPNDLLSFSADSGIQIARQSGICRYESLRLFLSREPLNGQHIKELNGLMRQVVDHMVNGKTIKCRSLLQVGKPS